MDAVLCISRRTRLRCRAASGLFPWRVSTLLPSQTRATRDQSGAVRMLFRAERIVNRHVRAKCAAPASAPSAAIKMQTFRPRAHTHTASLP